jgi:hypothetical protein
MLKGKHLNSTSDDCFFIYAHDKVLFGLSVAQRTVRQGFDFFNTPNLLTYCLFRNGTSFVSLYIPAKEKLDKIS